MKYIVISIGPAHRADEEFIGPFQSMPEAFAFIHTKIEQLTNDIELADDQWLETKGSFFGNEIFCYTKNSSGHDGERKGYFKVRPLAAP